MNLYKSDKLTAALAEYVRRQNTLLPDDGALSRVTLSQEYRRQMERLLARRKRGFYVLFGTVGRRVASVAIAVLAAATVTTVSVEALRQPVFQFFAEIYERFTQVLFVDQEPRVLVTEIEKRTPTYISEGYVMEEESDLDTYYKVVYVNEKNEKIRYAQRWKKHIEMQVDTEDIQYTTITIGDLQGLTYKNEDIITITFSDNKYTYTLSGSVSINELQKMAESLIF